MQHFTRFIAKLSLILISFLYFILCEQMMYKWKSLSPDLPHEYIFSADHQEKRNWYDARRWCKETGGGDLLTIKSQLEARTINTELKKAQSTFKAHWIGLQDLNNDGIWTWFDGTEFDVRKLGFYFIQLLSDFPGFVDSFNNGPGCFCAECPIHQCF